MNRTNAPETQPPRISFPALFHTVRRAVVDFDLDSVRTVVGLTRRPGPTVRHYLGAGRADLLNPAKYAVVTATIYVVANIASQRSDVALIFDPVVAAGPVFPYLALVLLLPIALLQRSLFPRRDVNAAECYAFWLFIAGHLALAATLLLALRYAPFDFPGFALLPLVAIWFGWALTGLYDDRQAWTWLRALLLFAVAVVLLGGLLFAFQWYRFAAMGG